MKMTKKDYIKIARIIKDSTLDNTNKVFNTIAKDMLINELSTMFKRDNSLFDRHRFKEACE